MVLYSVLDFIRKVRHFLSAALSFEIVSLGLELIRFALGR